MPLITPEGVPPSPAAAHSLILLNGGIGARVKAGQPKQLLTINGIPMLAYSLIAAQGCAAINEVVLNYPPGWRDSIETLVRDYAITKPVKMVEAGGTRHESVALMIPHCTNEFVVLHESARPMVTAGEFGALVGSGYRNVSYMHEIPFTVAPVDPSTGLVTGFLDRALLRNVQLPQRFAVADLLAAHAFAAEKELVFTEDATLCAVAGFDVHFIDGTDQNFKVTSTTDVQLAGFLLSGRGEE